jgi:CheY-like chemotaxis protein
LYVEDEETDFLFMQMAFEEAGMESALRRVGTGREAINYLAGDGHHADRGQYPLPAVILLDLNLPVLSGFAVLEWLRRKPDFRTLPVVVFTSSSREQDKQRALELGANDYVEKPKSGLQFGTVVQRVRDRWLRTPDVE